MTELEELDWLFLRHQAADELLACYLTRNPDAKPATTNVGELMRWALARQMELADRIAPGSMT